MSKRSVTYLYLSLFFFYSFSATAQITSTFDADADGWTVSDINGSNPKTVTFNGTGGNPNGFASAVINSTQPFYWTSPSKFGGNIAYFSYGQNLSFDLQINVTPTQHAPSYGDVMIESATGSRIVCNLPSFPAITPGWASFNVKLDETTAWRVNGISGALATKQQILQALSNVSAIRINGQYAGTQPITSGIDNVVLTQRTIQAPPVISDFSPLSGFAGGTLAINGNNFNTVAANNVVSFSGVKASVVSASATQLTVQIPAGAKVDYIRVTNLGTGLTMLSAQKFIPKFTGGGRFIRASLKPKAQILMDAAGGNLYPSVADIDGDGWVDIIVTESGINDVSILRNLGTGGDLSAASFATKVSLTTGNGGNVLADFDGDGKLDIAVNYSDGFYSYFAVYRNNSTPGTISFEAVKLFAGLVYSTSGIQTADIDGDGLTDLMGTHGNGSVSPDFWMAQNISTPGNIQFLSSKSYFGGSTLDAAGGINTGDLDGDGKPEITVIHGFNGRFSIIKNNSTPGTISLATPFMIDEGSVQGLVIADLDSDGKNDIVWSDYSDTDIRIKRNIYSGGAFDATAFESAVTIQSPLGYIMEGINVADMNGDGKIDLAQGGSSDIAVYENMGSPGTINSNSFGYGVPFQARATSYPSGPAIADLNGDQKPDLIFGTTNNTPTLFIYQNQNVHTPVISLNTVSPLAGPVGSTVTITGSDFSTTPSENLVQFGTIKATVQTATQNTLTVIVPAGAPYAPVSVTRNNLTARYHLPFSLTFASSPNPDGSYFAPAVSFTLTTADYDVEIGDLDGDGKPDVAAEGASLRTYLFKNTHSGGAITVSSLTPHDTTNTSAQNPRIMDIDEDGKPDLSTGSGVYRNATSSGPIAFDNLVSLGNAFNSSWADYNLDGKTDFAGTSGTAVSVYENWSLPGAFVNNGYLSSISDAINYTKPATGGGTATADLDGDGYADFAATNGATDNITVWRNLGDYRLTTASFTNVGNFAAGDNPGRIYTGDIDRDGKVDLVVYNGGTTQNISVFHNQSTSGNIVLNKVDFALGYVPTTSTIVDLDGDGKPDIITTSEAGDRVSVFKNTSTPGVLNASSFAAPVHSIINNPRAVAAGDINLDGKPDLIVTSAPNSLLILQNALLSAPVITIGTHPATTYACEDSNATMTVSASGTANITYQWQRFNTGSGAFENIANGGGYSGVTTSTLTVNTAAGFGAGDYRAKISGNNAVDAFSNQAMLVVNTRPDAPATSGANSCVPAALSLSASGSIDGNYRWYDIASGGSALAGKVNSIFLTPVLSGSTTYYASIVETSGGLTCESNRTPALAQINLLPKPVATLQSPVVNPDPANLQLCAGQTATLTAPAGFTSYSWSTGENSQQINIDDTDSYSFTVTDINGCVSPVSDPVIATVNANPVAAITLNSTALTATPGDNYQWYQSNQPVSGATAQTMQLNVLEYGVYAVEVTDNGCTSRSADFVYLVTAQEEFMNGLKVYPNPVKHDLTVEHDEQFQVSMFDLRGRKIEQSENKGKKFSTDLSAVVAGVYLLVIKTNEKAYYIKITKE